MSPVKYNSFT